MGGTARGGSRSRHHRSRKARRERRSHDGRRGSAHGSRTRAEQRVACRLPRSRRTGGSGTSSPVPTTDACGPIPTPDGFAGALRPYQERGSAGSPSSVTSVSGPASLTTWVSARRPSSWRCWSTSAPVQPRRRRGAGLRPQRKRRSIPRAAGSDARAVPGVGARQLAARGRPLRPEAVGLRPPRIGSTRREGLRPSRRARWIWCCRPMGWPPATSSCWRRCRGDGSSLDEAQQIKNSAARTTQSVRAIPSEQRDRHDRHASGEPPVRALVDHAVPQPGHAWARRRPSAIGSPSRSSVMVTTRPQPDSAGSPAPSCFAA